MFRIINFVILQRIVTIHIHTHGQAFFKECTHEVLRKYINGSDHARLNPYMQGICIYMLAGSYICDPICKNPEQSRKPIFSV